MKRQLAYALLALVVLLAPFGAAPAVSAQPAMQVQEESLVDVWVFHDADRSRVYSNGDFGFTDVPVCLYNWDTQVNNCGGTDQGDVWWEIGESGRFVTWVDLSQYKQDYILKSIECRTTRTNEIYRGCVVRKSDWLVGYNLPIGTRINIFYALVRK